ncbi:GNAT family N-acetyltransferase [Cohnella thermotolerans]
MLPYPYSRNNNGELGFFIHCDYWNTGFATEACQALIEFGFKQLVIKK